MILVVLDTRLLPFYRYRPIFIILQQAGTLKATSECCQREDEGERESCQTPPLTHITEKRHSSHHCAVCLSVCVCACACTHQSEHSSPDINPKTRLQTCRSPGLQPRLRPRRKHLHPLPEISEEKKGVTVEYILENLIMG